MRAKKSTLRVFKLRSGEEIIAKIAGKPRGKIAVERPMKINYSVSADPYTGMKKSVVFFTDWLGATTELSVNIPTDFILVDLTPDPDMEQLYYSQREAQDQFRAAAAAPKADPLAGLVDDDDDKYPMPTEEELKKLDEFLKAAIGLDPSNDGKTKQPPKKPKQPLPPTFPPLPPPSGVVFSVSLPSDLINEWVQSGIMDYLKDCVDDFMESEMEEFHSQPPPKKKKKKSASASKEKQSKEAWTPPTEDQVKQPDYGNKFTDWSPYLKDYISGVTGEKPPEAT